MHNHDLKLANTVIFAGISIARSRILERVEASVFGPIKRGDLSHIKGQNIIVLIDGEFGQNLSVSPKEILAAIDKGCCVIGASSMGALRAAELDQFGMRGVGWVYERFAKATVRREDEVALTFNPFSGKSLTIPLVDIIYWIENLLSIGAISKSESRNIEQIGRRIFFADRTRELFLSNLEKYFSFQRLEEILGVTNYHIPDIKALDAEAAISAAIEIGTKISSIGGTNV